MFKKSLLAALCLISALTAQAAPTPNIPITQSQLPFTISTPGTYVLTGNLSYTSGSEFGAININGAIGGAVVIDLKGFTLTSASGASKAGVSISENTFPTTIRNGTITSFANGISVFVSGNPPILSNITIKNIVFNQESNAGVNLDQLIDGATVNGCTFDNCGISDSLSTGGNSYNNNTFVNGVALDVQSYCCGTPLVLNRCQFASPPATGLIMNAIPVKAAPKSANIPISSLPFTITGPGTYSLTRNLSYTGGGTNPAINISGPIGGPIIVDLKGFTITGVVGGEGVSISGSTALYPITIRNGTITMFTEGVVTNPNFNFSNITINNIVFDTDQIGVAFRFVDSSTVSNCTFNHCGIEDDESTGGNIYNNNIFGLGGERALAVQSQLQLVLDRCDFAAPPPTN